MAVECPISGKACDIGDCASAPQCNVEVNSTAEQVRAEYKSIAVHNSVFSDTPMQYSPDNLNKAVERIAQTYGLDKTAVRAAVLNQVGPDISLQ